MEARRSGKGAICGVTAGAEAGATPVTSDAWGGQSGSQFGGLRDAEFLTPPAALEDLGPSAGLSSGLIQWTVYTRENLKRDAGGVSQRRPGREKDFRSQSCFLRQFS